MVRKRLEDQILELNDDISALIEERDVLRQANEKLRKALKTILSISCSDCTEEDIIVAIGKRAEDALAEEVKDEV